MSRDGKTVVGYIMVDDERIGVIFVVVKEECCRGGGGKRSRFPECGHCIGSICYRKAIIKAGASRVSSCD